jgi:peptidoglycan/xylan/chitin deacetylase (PgdA/CDA1 family)
MKLLKNNFEIIKSDCFQDLNPAKKYIIITFDDGFENLIYNAVPILKKLNLPFTIFFISNYFGKLADWEFKNGHRDKNQKIMTVDQMNNLDSNLVTIGSHTANHKKLTSLSEEKLDYELSNSKKTLEKLTHREITILSFPNGEFNSSIVNKSLEAGYKRVFTIDPKFSLRSKNENVTGRVWVNGNDWSLEFWLKANGGYCWLDIAFSLRKKIQELF